MSKVELWEQKQKKKITKSPKPLKIKEIDIEILGQKLGIMNKKKLVAAD